MCGRYAATKDPATLAAEFDALDATEDHAPPAGPQRRADQGRGGRRAAAPARRRGQPGPGHHRAQPAGDALGPGPGWAKDLSIGARMINARSETAADEPRSARALAKRRCLSRPTAGTSGSRDGEPQAAVLHDHARTAVSLAMAGLWTVLAGPKDDRTARPGAGHGAVLTTAASGRSRAVHDRMPLLMTAGHWAPGSTRTSSRGRRVPAARAAVAGAGRGAGAAAGVDARSTTSATTAPSCSTRRGGRDRAARPVRTESAHDHAWTIDTPHGPARAELHCAPRGAGRAAARARRRRRRRRARPGRRHPGRRPPRACTSRWSSSPTGSRAAAPRRPPHQLDTAWLAVADRLSRSGSTSCPLVFGGRSSGARVACRTVRRTGRPSAVLCLAFPVHPPGRPEKTRMPELDGVTVPTLVVQGESDPFGSPEPAHHREIVVLPGDHSLKPDARGCAAA